MKSVSSHLKTVSLASDSSLCTDSTFFCDPEALLWSIAMSGGML